MYEKRIRILIVFSLLLLMICVLRLAQMQLLTASSVHNEIDELKRRKGQSEQFKTLRGKILDRNGNVLALDQVRFWIYINYELSSFLDERVRQAMFLETAGKSDPEAARAKVDEKIREKIDGLRHIIDKCAQFKGVEPWEIEEDIRKTNDDIWNLRVFQAWRRKFRNSEVLKDYNNDITDVPGPVARADFESKLPDPNERIRLVNEVDIIEMYKSEPLLELKTDDDVFAAQVEFMGTEGIQITSNEERFYPYRSVAAQTIGWVGVASQKSEEEFFAEDKLAKYLDDEVCGKEGVEYVCEAILRGRRGEEIKDIDNQLLSRTDTEFGKDVSLTLDIELQAAIEEYLNRHEFDPSLGKPNVSAVVIDVGSSDILALVSMPVYDLNCVRNDYDELINDTRKPTKNRAINMQYPPGSVVKPLILIAGLETKAITIEEVIECLAVRAPKGWPNCLIVRRGSGHTLRWENTARNAIKGSCNIYFSRLADRIEPLVLQQWLFRFGLGQYSLSMPYSISDADGAELRRNFLQLPGEISSISIWGKALNFEEMPPLAERDRRYFGIGQGNLSVTPLQVANSMATIARRGIFKLPRLLADDSKSSAGVDLNISPVNMDVVWDGMSAVVNEEGGTANAQFQPLLSILEEEDVKVYGKTGSTERPYHAWFAGFATDSDGRKIAVAVIVEKGQHGSSDAAPLAREIIQLTINAGYIGKPKF